MYFSLIFWRGMSFHQKMTSSLHVPCSLILETDANVIAEKVSSAFSGFGPSLTEQVLQFQQILPKVEGRLDKLITVARICNKILLSLQSFSQALATARGHLTKTLLKWYFYRAKGEWHRGFLCFYSFRYLVRVYFTWLGLVRVQWMIDTAPWTAKRVKLPFFGICRRVWLNDWSSQRKKKKV